MDGLLFELLALGGLCAFIAFKIYEVLGRRTGNERSSLDDAAPPSNLPRAQRGPANGKDNVVVLPTGRTASPPVRASATSDIPADSPIMQGLTSIKAHDSSFDADEFLGGARVAHEMIVRSYANGDDGVLKDLLSAEVYKSFSGAISAREKAGQKMDFTFVGLKQAKFEAAVMRERIAEVTVRFVSELISVTKDAAGVVIEGAAGVVREVTDIWTFARDTRSSDPNWKLIATAGA